MSIPISSGLTPENVFLHFCSLSLHIGGSSKVSSSFGYLTSEHLLLGIRDFIQVIPQGLMGAVVLYAKYWPEIFKTLLWSYV